MSNVVQIGWCIDCKDARRAHFQTRCEACNMKYEEEQEEQEERARLVALYPGPVHAETIDMLMDTRRTVKENHRWVQAELDALDREEEIKREIPKIALKFALLVGAIVFVLQAGYYWM